MSSWTGRTSMIPSRAGGNREAIAQVGSWLVNTCRAVPPDLRVKIPDLEAALLTLLDSDDTQQMGAAS